MDTHQFHQYTSASPDVTSPITIGTVVDTNDPQQMGRIRVVCPQWGDSWSTPVESLPWALYISPFGGHVERGSRGPGIQESNGSVAYGMWAIPKVNARVTVMCIDGNPMNRAYFGCLFDQFTPHTLPHGRYMFEDHPKLEKGDQQSTPYGPFTSTESPIEPLATNQKRAFITTRSDNFEYQTRGADYTASRVDVSQLDQTVGQVQDDKNTNGTNGWVSTQGYQNSRIDPTGKTSVTDKNYDSMVYSLTTPGFHSLSMDDRQENCRVRFRTTSGHQIILDDTNERIYVSTAEGNNWIEMDQNGNIDVYSSTRVSIRSAKDINLTADDTIRMTAGNGVHINAKETRVSGDSLKVKTDTIASKSNAISIDTGSLNLQGNTVNIQGDSVNLKGSVLSLQSTGTLNLLAGGSMLVTGSVIHLNGTPASPASSATVVEPEPAMLTNRVPDHEPWPRTMTADDYSHTPEHGVSSSNVNRVERGSPIARGMYWRR